MTDGYSRLLSSQSNAMERFKMVVPIPKDQETESRASVTTGSRDWTARVSTVNDPDGVWATVAQYIEQLRTTASTHQQKESLLKQLLDLISSREDGSIAAGSHPQTVPVLVALLRSGSPVAKASAAMILCVLSKQEELRIKVLLGGSIPPLLSLLKSSSAEAQVAAARTLWAVSQGGENDNVGPKIFATEGVVPNLWDQLKMGTKLTKSIDGILTGTLRNLCRNTEGFWEATSEAGGVDVLLRLLSVGSSEAQSNTCYLLASMMMEDESSCFKVAQAGTIDCLLKLLSPGNELSVRAEAAGTLKALSFKFKESRQLIIASNGIPTLIKGTVAPSKEFMEGNLAQALQENTMGTLANISGGLHSVILRLAETIDSDKSDVHIADTIGALASALMVYDGKKESVTLAKPAVMEQILVKQLKYNVSEIVKERATEALASLYGNNYLSDSLRHAEGKKMLIGLITMASPDAQEELLKSFRSLCNSDTDLWQSLKQRQGVQLLISLLGVSTEQQQECAVALLSILSQERDESKWAITAGGGIPPLVQLLETGSAKAKEDSAVVLGNLCSHSEDIRSCVESAGAVPALLWLLKNSGSKGQEIAGQALKQLVRRGDASTISQLHALLDGSLPESKLFVLDTLGHLLSDSLLEDILHEGTAVHDAFEVMLRLLGSSKEETKQHSASVLAVVFHKRKDFRESRIAVKCFAPLLELLNARTEAVAMHAAQSLSALFSSIKENHEVAQAAQDAIVPLVNLAKSTSVDVAEQAISALSYLFLDTKLVEKAPTNDIILPLTRVLREGTVEGKARASTTLAQILQSRSLDETLAQSIHQCHTVLALVAFLSTTSVEDRATLEGLEALASLTRVKRRGSFVHPPWAVLAENPYVIGPLVTFLAMGPPLIQEKVVEVLSRLCREHPVVLGDMISGTSRCVAALAEQVITSSNLEIKIGASALLICAAKEHHQRAVDALFESKSFVQVVQSLVQMIGPILADNILDTDGSESDRLGMSEFMRTGRKIHGSKAELVPDLDSVSDHDPATTLGKTVALWLLSILASYDSQSKFIVMEAGAIEIVTERIASFHSSFDQIEGGKDGSTWVSVLLLAILFQDRDVVRAPAVIRAIPVLATILKSEEAADKYFAAQALASLVCNGSRGTLLAVANSGAPGSLISLIGSSDADISNLLSLAEEFSLFHNPEEVVLERLFRVDDIRTGSTARKVIPALVELLKPIAERPGAPVFALKFLTQLAVGSNANKIAMAEAGALEALAKYLSLGPQDNMEEIIADLLRVLFSSADLRRHESALGALNQLIAVLRLGARGARYSAARALQGLFAAEYVKFNDAARQAIPPLLEMLRTGTEKEQRAAIGALTKLSYDNPPKALAITDAEVNCLEVLCKILSANCTLELKEETAELCCVLFSYSRVRSNPAAASCVEQLLMLLRRESSSTWLAIVLALGSLLENDSFAELAAARGAVGRLVEMLAGDDHALHQAVVNALIKLGKDRPHCKLEMMKYGVIEWVLQILPMASDTLCASIAELLRILTNNSNIAKGLVGSEIVQPLLSNLARPGLSIAGQHSTMQALVNILEKPQQLANYKLSPTQAFEPLISFLDSPSQPVQQLAVELLSHLLVEKHLQHESIPLKVVVPLVQLAGVGMNTLEQRAILALESVSHRWPKEIADAGGIEVLSKVMLQLDPLPPHALWEAAASVLRNILHCSSECYLQVPIQVLVRMLQSTNESTIVAALQAMLVLEQENSSFAEAMARSGAVEALLELLRCHQCEEAAAQLVEALLNNRKVREMKVALMAISPLSQYLLDPQTQAQPGRLLAALALGDLFQQEELSRSSDAILACRALVGLLEDQPTEEIKTVALCALQNLMISGHGNKRAIAEAGGVQVVLELLGSSNKETAGQAAALIKLMFSNHTIREYASSELIRTLSVSLQNDLSSGSDINEDTVRAIAVLFTNFTKLRGTAAATLIIPQLITALKVGSEAVQDAALDTLYLLKQAWSASSAEVGQAQAIATAEAIPVLQTLIKSGPQRFHERANALLQCLPGNLVIIIKRGSNLKQSMGSTNAFCKVTLGTGPPQETKVISHSTAPEWNEEFTWAFDTPPKGQKLHITCKSKNAFGKGSFGKVTIQVDRAVTLGTISGVYALQRDKNRDGAARTLEIEVTWSNR